MDKKFEFLKNVDIVKINLLDNYSDPLLAFVVYDSNKQAYVTQETNKVLSYYFNNKIIYLLYDTINNGIKKGIFSLTFTDNDIIINCNRGKNINISIDFSKLEYKNFINHILKLNEENLLFKAKKYIKKEEINNIYISNTNKSTCFYSMKKDIVICHDVSDSRFNCMDIVNLFFDRFYQNEECEGYIKDDKKIILKFKGNKNIIINDIKNKNKYIAIIDKFQNKLIDEKIEENRKVKMIKYERDNNGKNG